jgi:hypothetical protein
MPRDQGREVVMHQRIVDRWIETAEANRVYQRAMGEQKLPRPITVVRQALLLLAKLPARMMLVTAHEPRPVSPGAPSTA